MILIVNAVRFGYLSRRERAMMTKSINKWSPDGFRDALIGCSFKELWDEKGHQALQRIGHDNGLMWEQMWYCEEGSEQAERVREGDDETYVWLICQDGKIVDVVWG